MRCSCGHEFCWVCGATCYGGEGLHFLTGPCSQFGEYDNLQFRFVIYIFIYLILSYENTFSKNIYHVFKIIIFFLTIFP